MAGVYRITNVINGKIYVGSAIDIPRRKYDHFYQLEHKTHINKHLQRAFNKHGKDNFVFDVIEKVYFPLEFNKKQKKVLILAREQYYLNMLLFANQNDSRFYKLGYNICRIAGSRLGTPCSQEAKEKNRRAQLGKKISEDTKLKISIANSEIGKKLNKEQVLEIYSFIKEGILTYNEIANKYNITGDNVCRIANGHIWKSLKLEPIKRPHVINSKSKPLSEEIINQIIEMRKLKYTIKQMSHKLNISRAVCSKYLKRYGLVASYNYN